MSSIAAAIAAAQKHLQAGQVEQARAVMFRAVQKDPAHPDACNIYAMTLHQAGQHQQAEFYLRRAVQADPGRVSFWNNLGMLLYQTRRLPEAIDAYRKAIVLDPAYPHSYVGLSAALAQSDQYDEAVEVAREGVRRDPQSFKPAMALASALLHAGRLEERIRYLREAIDRFPDQPALLGGLVFAMNYWPGTDRREHFELHRRYGALATRLAKQARPPDFAGTPEPDRPLRIAYLSPDLRTHSVAFFLEPILAEHDRARYPVTCYSTFGAPDDFTARLKGLSDSWVDAHGWTDDRLADRVRADKVDLLVDLAGHTLEHRLGVLARRAAPVQITYLGYPNTTGLPQVDYRIVDSVTDPAEPPTSADACATERLVRLDPCFLCYRPPSQSEAVVGRERPASGPATFGSFNNYLKITPEAASLWGRILASVPGSRLLIKSVGLRHEPTRLRVAAMLEAGLRSAGVDPSRLEVLTQTTTPAEHLALYSRIDIALDTFPYGGTTTTCEALWMGVPVVTLAGLTHASRVGASLLRCAGLPDLVADSPDAYIAIASSLARDPARLGALRTGLRPQLAASPLCDAKAFARCLESAYRDMWRSRCAARAGASS